MIFVWAFNGSVAIKWLCPISIFSGWGVTDWALCIFTYSCVYVWRVCVCVHIRILVCVCSSVCAWTCPTSVCVLVYLPLCECERLTVKRCYSIQMISNTNSIYNFVQHYISMMIKGHQRGRVSYDQKKQTLQDYTVYWRNIRHCVWLWCNIRILLKRNKMHLGFSDERRGEGEKQQPMLSAFSKKGDFCRGLSAWSNWSLTR